MLQKDFKPHEDQDQAAGKFGFFLITAAKYISNLNTCGRQKEGNASDKEYGRQDPDLKEGKGYAYGQGINAASL